MRDDLKATWTVHGASHMVSVAVDTVCLGGATCPYLELSVKWDGCMDIHIKQDHWCGPEGFMEFAELVRELYNEAYRRMGQEPEELWPETLDAEPIYEVVETVFTESSPAQASQLDQGQRS